MKQTHTDTSTVPADKVVWTRSEWFGMVGGTGSVVTVAPAVSSPGLRSSRVVKETGTETDLFRLKENDNE